MKQKAVRERAQLLRKKGNTYAQIEQKLGLKIPKSTLSYWNRHLELSLKIREVLRKRRAKHLVKARLRALLVKKQKREEYFKNIEQQVQYFAHVVKNRDTGKVALAMLYLGEGSKGSYQAALTFGNSNPAVIDLFLRLLRTCYPVDEKKFRCTLQCRADQPIKQLEQFWSRVTKIPPAQFYGVQVDPRTIGKRSMKKEYRGVCRINYFSAAIYHEIMKIIEVIVGP